VDNRAWPAIVKFVRLPKCVLLEIERVRARDLDLAWRELSLRVSKQGSPAKVGGSDCHKSQSSRLHASPRRLKRECEPEWDLVAVRRWNPDVL
jgi:hypothetical protein